MEVETFVFEIDAGARPHSIQQTYLEWWRGRDSSSRPSPPDLRGLQFALLAEGKQVAVDEVGMRGGEAVRQTRIVDFDV
jgi:hypothetical protein